MTDVTRTLEQDHRLVEHLFEQIKKHNGSKRAELVEQLAADLRTHMRVEESVVYPFILEKLSEGEDMVEEARTEHDGARKVLAEVERLSPDEPGFDGALAMLEAGIAHHVEEEETEVFPKLRKSASAEELNDVGARVEEAKANAAFEAMSREELLRLARETDLAGRSSMTKKQLIEALSDQS